MSRALPLSSKSGIGGLGIVFEEAHKWQYGTARWRRLHSAEAKADKCLRLI